jgi:hypothetical protein
MVGENTGLAGSPNVRANCATNRLAGEVWRSAPRTCTLHMHLAHAPRTCTSHMHLAHAPRTCTSHMHLTHAHAPTPAHACAAHESRLVTRTRDSDHPCETTSSVQDVSFGGGTERPQLIRATPPKFIMSGHLKEEVQMNHRDRQLWAGTSGRL